jgi:hypothetical protein
MENDNTELIDYVRTYCKSVKTLQEMYLPQKGDELESINEQCAIVKSGKSKKKISTKDYLTKSIQECLLSESEEKKEYVQMTLIPSEEEKKNLSVASNKVNELNKKIIDANNAPENRKHDEAVKYGKQELGIRSVAKANWPLDASDSIDTALSQATIKNEKDLKTVIKPETEEGKRLDKEEAEKKAKDKEEAEKKAKDKEEENMTRMKKYHGK